MALHDFWKNVRAAAKYLGPQVIADAPRSDVETIDNYPSGRHELAHSEGCRRLRGAGILVPARRRRSKLAELVAEFHSAASSVGPTAPVPEDTIERAIPLFRDFVRTLEFDRHGDAEALRLGKINRMRP